MSGPSGASSLVQFGAMVKNLTVIPEKGERLFLHASHIGVGMNSPNEDAKGKEEEHIKVWSPNTAYPHDAIPEVQNPWGAGGGVFTRRR